jgi:hypothetical protein
LNIQFYRFLIIKFLQIIYTIVNIVDRLYILGNLISIRDT